MTADDAAVWMVQELAKRRYLDHEIVAYGLLKLDKALVYYNDAGNLAVHKVVLDAFRRAIPDDVVWSRGERHWRYRQKNDRPGRMQD
jgi:DNA-binding FrmR family transcriptional regulator